MDNDSNELKSLEYIANYRPIIPVFIPYKYVLIHTKKGIILARETNDKKIVRNLLNNRLYNLKSEDKKEYVSEMYVFNALKDQRDKDKDSDNKKMQWMQFITSPVLGALTALYINYTTTVSLFQTMAGVFGLAFLIYTIYIIKGRLKKNSDEIYHTVLKEIG
ncbi:MAG: hypothetical protein MPEBLZ_01656 [Candidatus Methanoperedens nitroreducens]|uniref:Uncharacterized protein n=1 Tax=Candidatus Methanoperedens nitratireducens TaxID=1392998 RepID=A0A0P7ZJ26_9EURY|nr:MAG: hypothetical protein MPEBLZ_01656 [Candidatus Methanoperedens sp. BLZ1]